MPIEYRDIETLGINPVPFSILTPDNQTARIMVFQCGGAISTDNAVGHIDKNIARVKFDCFFRKAKEVFASLVVTPEYSCPWDIITNILIDPQKFPDPGALWIIGCESITLDEINQIKQNTSDFVSWHSEVPVPNGNQKFLSPVLYLFRLVKEDKASDLFALVQFKTHDIGGSDFERDHLIKGNVRYVLHNPSDPASIKLMTVICADALIFDTKAGLNANQPYLIVHPQLNLSPYHHSVNEYRSKIFGSGLGDKCEILSLNWAQGFNIAGKTSKDHGGSAYYMHPHKADKEPNQDEKMIEANHRKGIYLTFSDEYRYSAFLFSNKEAVFLFDTTKVSQFNSPIENQSRSGPCAVATYFWGNDNWEEVNDIDDGVKGIFQAGGGSHNMKACEREKLLVISNGDIDPGRKAYFPQGLNKALYGNLYPVYWHKPRNLSSYYLNAKQSPQGTIVRLQESQDSEIANKISCFTTLKEVLSRPEELPEVLDDFKKLPPIIMLDLSGDEEGATIRHNVRTNSGKGWAAASYVGDTTEARAKIKFSNIKTTLSPQRTVVWFRYNGILKCLHDQMQKISDVNEPLEAITKGE